MGDDYDDEVFIVWNIFGKCYLGDAGGSEGLLLPDLVPIIDLLNSNFARESIFWATRGAFSESSRRKTSL